jgi:hypothetical protein
MDCSGADSGCCFDLVGRHSPDNWENLLFPNACSWHLIDLTYFTPLSSLSTLHSFQLIGLLSARTRALILYEADIPPQSRSTGLLSWLPQRFHSRIAKDPAFVAENIAFIQTYLIWQTKLIPRIATELYQYLWVVAKNPTRIPFFTSDAPVAGFSHATGQAPYFPTPRPYSDNPDELSVVKRLFVEDSMKGEVEIIFPLSPALALMMFHPSDFEKELGHKQGKVLVLGLESVMLRNALIAGTALRQVLSLDDDFWLANAAREYDLNRNQSSN